MKKLLLAAAITGMTVNLSFGAVDGKELFNNKTNRCAICHKETKDAIGPSLKTIAEYYKNNPDQLKAFLKGEADPIIWPDRFNMMKPQMGKLKAMSDEEINALVEYILKH
ncbi:c-type cytochrome [Persephonella sp.]